ncbi:hypothetical protein SAMN05428949_6567 [Chitinophaga sp. YR627]|uniref:hypothetical protein n=1 Tax=Chitinophaga sp. YR627 TaxID=1881041 RepID=UPI0008EC0B7B|nr:hypothetical protein [Chitinophaga sp. YR627]SFO77010.1 hypothetical protein SAMN05428949_6567 [Chitinophaga sp. YR627]
MEFTNIHYDPEMIRSIKRSKREMRLLGMTSIVLAVLSGYFSAGYPWLGLVLFCCTPLSLYLIARHKNVLTPEMNPSEGLSGVFFIPLIVGAGLMAACNFIEILHYVDVLTPAALIFAALTWLMWRCIRRFIVNKKLFYTVSAVMLLAFAGNGIFLTILLNKLLSKRCPRIL